MATIDDIGVPGAPMSAPALTPWQHAVRDRIKDLPIRIQSGVATITLNNASSGSVAIPLTGFTAPPVVVMSSRNNSFVVGPGTPTSSSVTAWARHVAGTPQTLTFSVDWIAIQGPAAAQALPGAPDTTLPALPAPEARPELVDAAEEG